MMSCREQMGLLKEIHEDWHFTKIQSLTSRERVFPDSWYGLLANVLPHCTLGDDQNDPSASS